MPGESGQVSSTYLSRAMLETMPMHGEHFTVGFDMTDKTHYQRGNTFTEVGSPSTGTIGCTYYGDSKAVGL